MSVSEIIRAIGALGGITLIVASSQWVKKFLRRKLRGGCNRFFPML